MIYTGIASITFRKLKPIDIVNIVKKAELNGIEWGGDIHVPHGDQKQAKEVRKMTEENGLYVSSYGSYYRVGCCNENTARFEDVLETALTLNAPNIRVWAGNRGTLSADQTWWNNVIEDTKRIAEIAKKENTQISFEYHQNTLTDNPESAIRLMKEINEPNVFLYWQPNQYEATQSCLHALKSVTPWLSNVHVFHWKEKERFSLRDGEQAWREYINVLRSSNREHYCLLEFVKEDNPEQFILDAKTLRSLLNIV